MEKRKTWLIIGTLLMIIVGITFLYNRFFSVNYYAIANINVEETQILELLTSQIINEAIVSDQAPVSKKTVAELILESSIKQRKEYVLHMMESNPEAFLRNAISNEVRSDLFGDALGIEKEIAIEGRIEIVCDVHHKSDDHDEHASTYVRVVYGDGTYTVHFPKPKMMEGLQTGDQVKIIGYALEDKIVPNTLANDDNFKVLAEATTVLPNAVNNKVAVIMVNFAENTSQPYNASQVRTAMQQARDYYEEITFGQVTFSGKNDSVVDIYGYYTVPYNNCNYSSWMTEGQKAAGKDGFAASGYRHIIVLFPRVGTCESGVAGRGTLSGNNIWLFSTISVGTIVHEMGHNWGLHHARSASCTNAAGTKVQVSDDCTYSEYGDPWDRMGGSNIQASTPHFQGFSKNVLGWIPNTNKTTVTKDGIYDLYPIEKAVTGPQLIAIPITYRTASGTNATWTYYLDFRTASPIDKYLPDSTPTRGVIVRNATSKGAYTNLYDANPLTNGTLKTATGGSSSSALYDSPVAIGQTFSDPIRKVDIKVLTANDTKATVEIKFTGDPNSTCTKSDPTVTITPSSTAVAPGEAVSYRVDIKNNDSKDCPAAAFSISSTVPAGFTQDKKSDSVTLSPGGSGTLNFTITSKTDSYNGTYSLTFVGSNGKLYSANYIITKGQDEPVCVRTSSTVAVSPKTGTAKAGTALEYTVEIKNNDNTYCGASSYSISTKLPSGTWSIDANNITASVKPGEIYSKTFKITPKSNEKDSTNTIPFTVKNNTTGVSSSINVTYVVDSKAGTNPTCVTANPAISIAPSSFSGESGKAATYTISIKNNDSVLCQNSEYAITPKTLTGFTFNNTSSKITVGPGQTGTAPFVVTPGSGVANGVYSVGFDVKVLTSSYSTSATYSVLNNTVGTPASINITGVIDGQKLNGNGNVKIGITATHSKGISLINVYLNNVKVQSCSNPKNGACDYSVNVNKLAAGTYVLKVEAVANDGLQTTNSKIVTFLG